MPTSGIRRRSPPNASIGADCSLGKGAYVGTGSRVGDRVKLGNYACVIGASIGDDAMISPLAALLEEALAHIP